MKKRISMILLISILLTGCVTSQKTTDNCTEELQTEPQIAETQITETEETRAYPQVPAGTDYDGYTYRILGCDGSYDMHNDYVLSHDEEHAEIITDAIYRRNMTVSEALNVQIEAEIFEKTGETLKKCVEAGDDTYAVAFLTGGETPSYLTKGILLELMNGMQKSWDGEWYDQNYIQSMCVDGRLYTMDSAITTRPNNETSALFFNKGLAKQYHLPDLYALVQEGKWTMDLLYSYYTSAEIDVNGDGKMGDEDTFGFGGNGAIAYIFYKGMGGDFLSVKDGGITDVLGKEENINRMMDVLERFSSPTMPCEGIEEFQEDRLLFWVYALGAFNWLRDSDVDFGVLPIPKESEEQSRYYCNVNYWLSAHMCVPKCAVDLEKIGTITDVLSAESYYTLQKAYNENALKSKYARSEEDTEIIDLLLKSRVYDIAIQYQIGAMSKLFKEKWGTLDKTVASDYEKNKSSIDAAIDSFMSALESMEDAE